MATSFTRLKRSLDGIELPDYSISIPWTPRRPMIYTFLMLQGRLSKCTFHPYKENNVFIVDDKRPCDKVVLTTVRIMSRMEKIGIKNYELIYL